MSASEIEFWLTVVGAVVGIMGAVMALFLYVWKDDRKRLKALEDHKADRQELRESAKRSENDFSEIKRDIRDLRTYLMGPGAPRQT